MIDQYVSEDSRFSVSSEMCSKISSRCPAGREYMYRRGPWVPLRSTAVRASRGDAGRHIEQAGSYIPNETRQANHHRRRETPINHCHTALRRPTHPLSAMAPQTYYLVSLPASIAASGDASEALTTLRSAVTTDNGTTYPFNVPHFKIGTLDALVQQADELARLEGGCKGVVDKVADSLRSLLEGDEDKIQEQKVVNDRECSDSEIHIHSTN